MQKQIPFGDDNQKDEGKSEKRKARAINRLVWRLGLDGCEGFGRVGEKRISPLRCSR
jgi:hypothetical protein